MLFISLKKKTTKIGWFKNLKDTAGHRHHCSPTSLTNIVLNQDIHIFRHFRKENIKKISATPKYIYKKNKPLFLFYNMRYKGGSDSKSSALIFCLCCLPTDLPFIFKISYCCPRTLRGFKYSFLLGIYILKYACSSLKGKKSFVFIYGF